jgi:hypothetical protein
MTNEVQEALASQSWATLKLFIRRVAHGWKSEILARILAYCDWICVWNEDSLDR